MKELVLVGLLGFALVGCANENGGFEPVRVTTQEIADASKKCDPYGGVATIKIYRPVQWSYSGEFYEMVCRDSTKVDVSTWQGNINSTQVTLEPKPSKKP